MERIERIRKHPLFQLCMRQIEEAEQMRIYCRHGMEHALDVARIAYIRNLEDGRGINQELIYAMALLHDIGRSKEYQSGISHHAAGLKPAEQILEECGFSEAEVRCIIQAIAAHKYGEDEDTEDEKQNESCSRNIWVDIDDEKVEYCRKLLYQADKLSRACYCCKARKTCYWTDEMKNSWIKY